MTLKHTRILGKLLQVKEATTQPVAYLVIDTWNKLQAGNRSM